MSFVGYADFDRPLDLASGKVFYPVGSGSFWLTPRSCTVASLPDGSASFHLDFERTLASTFADRALLEVELTAEYRSSPTLAELRAAHPAATASAAPLRNWTFRLDPQVTEVELLRELALPTPLASNDFGKARLVAPLSVEGGHFLESLLTGSAGELAGTAEADIMGVAPRLPVVVRFSSGELVPPLLSLADARGRLSRSSLLAFFMRDARDLPLTITGTLAPERALAFADSMADRVIARFGRYVAGEGGPSDPLVELWRPNGDAAVEVRWSLSQLQLVGRRLVLPLDLLSAARAQARSSGSDGLIRRRTMAVPPRFGQTRITAFCNLPADRRGVEAIGVTLEFPPSLPARPQSKRLTVTFEPPTDLVQADVRLSPGEPPSYCYSTFCVLSDERGSRELRGPTLTSTSPLLRLSPDDFPLDFPVVELSEELLQLASFSGSCEYELSGERFTIAFAIDQGQSAVSLALPKERGSAQVTGTLRARDGAETLSVAPFEPGARRLELMSLRHYGPQRVTLRCVFDTQSQGYGIELLPFDSDETEENISVLYFSQSEPERSFEWFARSPFRCGLRYRLLRSGGRSEPWREHEQSFEPLVLRGSELEQRRSERASAAVAAPRLFLEITPVCLTPRSESELAPETSAGLPISPIPEPSDEVLYTKADGSGKQLFLPSYQLDEEVVSGQRRYRISMREQSGAASLVVSLLVAPSPGIAEAARGAEELDHQVVIQLEYLVTAGDGVRKTLVFDDVSRSANVVTARLSFASLAERDDVFVALTEATRRARLVVQRFVDVSVPVRPRRKPTFSPGTLVRPTLALARPLTDLVLVKGAVVNPATAESPPLKDRTLPMARLAVSRAALLRNETSAVVRADFKAVAIDAQALRPQRPPKTFVPALPAPALVFLGIEDNGRYRTCRLGLSNWADYPAELLAVATDLDPSLLRPMGSRASLAVYDADTKSSLHRISAISSASQLSDFAFPLPDGSAAPKRVYVTLSDRRGKLVQQSDPVATNTPQTVLPPYQDVRRQLDVLVGPEPFSFSPALHAYMFQGVLPQTGNAQLVRYRLDYRNVFHTYFQDATRPEVVYFLPDCLKLARRDEPPFTPFATVRIAPRQGQADAQVIFDYVLAPFADQKRLLDARARLLAEPRFGATRLSFQPLLTSDARLVLNRPSLQGTARESREDAALVLREPMNDTLVMDVPDFGLLFDALQRPNATVFGGRVEVKLPHEDTELVPLVCRADDLAGELFSVHATVRDQGDIELVLKNEIESPVAIDTLDVTILSAGRVLRGRVTAGQLPVPLLAPGESSRLLVQPETELDSGPPEVRLDQGGVRVLVAPEAFWNAILDRTTLEYFATITVKTSASSFEPLPERPNDRILQIDAEFEGGGTAQLRPDRLEATVRVDYAVDDIVLRRPVDVPFRYRVTVHRAQGEPQRDSELREQTATTFWLSVTK